MPIMIWIAIIIEFAIQNWIDAGILLGIQFVNATLGWCACRPANPPPSLSVLPLSMDCGYVPAECHTLHGLPGPCFASLRRSLCRPCILLAPAACR